MSFHFLNSVFEAPKVLILMMSNLFFSFIAHAFGVIAKNPLPNPGSFIFAFSSKSIMILALIFRLLIYFELVFVYGVG